VLRSSGAKTIRSNPGPRGESRPRRFGGATLREVRLQAKAVELRSTGQPGRLSPPDSG
jgi:hypothetical protein